MGKKDFISCRVRRDYHMSHKSLKNEYTVILHYFIGERVSVEEDLKQEKRMRKINIILILSGLLVLFGASYTHGLTIILALLAFVIFKLYVNRLEKKEYLEKQLLAYYCECIFKSLKEWEKDINEECRENAQAMRRESSLGNKLSAMKEKISSSNYDVDGNYKIGEDGTIVR